MRKYGRSKDFEAMKAGKLAIWPKSQFLLHKNLPLRDFSIMTLITMHPSLQTKIESLSTKNRWVFVFKVESIKNKV